MSLMTHRKATTQEPLMPHSCSLKCQNTHANSGRCNTKTTWKIIRPTCLTSPSNESGHAASRQAQHSGSQALGSGRERVTDRIGSLLHNSRALRTHASTPRTGWTQLRSRVAASWNGTSAAQDLSGPIELGSDVQPSSSLRWYAAMAARDASRDWYSSSRSMSTSLEGHLETGTHRAARRPAA